MSQRSNTIKAAGLYTFLSELQAPEGSLVKADNINIDELGVVTQRRGFNDYGQALPLPEQRIKQILEYKNRILRYYDTTLEYDDGSGNFLAFSGVFNEVEEGFRIKSKEVNGNLYFTSSDGIKKISAKSPSQFNTNSGFILDAGSPKAIDISAKTIPTASGFLPPQSKVAYKVLFGYTDANNVLVLGSPTSRFVVTNKHNVIKLWFAYNYIYLFFVRVPTKLKFTLRYFFISVLYKHTVIIQIVFEYVYKIFFFIRHSVFKIISNSYIRRNNIYKFTFCFRKLVEIIIIVCNSYNIISRRITCYNINFFFACKKSIVYFSRM
jgi:hypothetical protein